MKKTLLTLSLALGASLTLGACSETQEPAETSGTPEYEIGAKIAEVVYPEGVKMTFDQLYDYSEAVCQGMDDGLDPLWMARTSAQEIPRYSLSQHSTVVGASIGANCPEYLDDLARYAE